MTDTQDLDKVRDEKCIPIAREILKDMTTDLVGENEVADFKPLILKTLKRTLDADLNIAMEVPYLFQLILGVLSGLNGAVHKSSPVKIDDVRYASIVRRLLTMVSDANIKMGAVTPEESAKEFEPLVSKFNDLFSAENLSFVEIKYVMDSIFDSFKSATDLFNKSLEESSQKAEAKLFGVDTMSDLTMGKLNSVLIEPKV